MASKKRRRAEDRDAKYRRGKGQVEEENAHDDDSEMEPEDKQASVFQAMTVDQKCDMIADLSDKVLQDPGSAFYSEKDGSGHDGEAETGRRLPSKMQNLLDLGRPYKNGNDEYVASLAIMSLLALFKDIIPSYRIRMPTDAERATKVSKETKRVWDYERALLTHYQQYLQLLEKTWEKGATSNSGSPSRLAICALLSVCELLKTAYHFNFRNNILTMVVRQANNRQCKQVNEACCDAIGYLFEKDAQGEVAREASRQLAKLIREYKGSLQANVLSTFLRLPLRVHVDEAQAAKLATAANKKKRKRDRETAEIESELQESSAKVDKLLLARCQADTLETVVLTYFRILKSEDDASRQALLPTALEGLAKFAHLINIDTVVDLLGLLKDLLVDVEALPLESSLNCILTAFQTLHGPGRELQIDTKEYVTPLYSQLGRLCTETNSRRCSKLMLNCLEAAFLRRREYSNVRMAAFFKQILTVAMHTPPATGVALMAFARQLLLKYPSLDQLLDSEADVVTSGQYTPDVADPELANPFSSVAWELSNLQFSGLHPGLAEQASSTLALKMLQMPLEEPKRLLQDFNRNDEEVYVSFRRNQKRHPLAPKANGSADSSKKKQKGRAQVRFITPRKQELTLISIADDGGE